MLLLTIVLALCCAGLAIEVLRLRAERNEMRWTEEKVFPLMLRVAVEDPGYQKLLDPESFHAFVRGEISPDEVTLLKQQPEAAPNINLRLL